MKETPPLDSPQSAPDAVLDASSKPTPPRSSKPWLWPAIGLAAVGLAYGVGRMQGTLALSGAEERHARAIEVARANLEACQVDRGLLTARQSLSLVALSLERRNFGVAESHRREASQTLEQPTLGGLAQVVSLASKIRGLNLGVDPDPGAKRQQVITVSEELDRVLTARAGAAQPAPVVSAAKAAE